ncbi:hypothetical protein GCM10022247_66010 [Allokutzneria multivorans]|uniref:MvdD-like pre-ATP grasp domain-containing protein n=1 Tax=Allokutzneria multivorans TaxID=1142134 RepID=A0ABP7TVQ2_9PSEU
MSGRTVIVVTSTWDLHSDVVISRLRERGADVVRINTEDVPRSTVLDVAFGDGEQGAEVLLRHEDREVDLARVRSVWTRPAGEWTFSENLQLWERAFAAAEAAHVVNRLWESLDCFWMSRPSAIEAASWKGEQLRRARRMGFAVPRTTITTDPLAVQRFRADSRGPIVTTALSGATRSTASGWADPMRTTALANGTATTVTEDLLRPDDRRPPVPCLLQEIVAKRAELNVTIVGDEVFAAEIHVEENRAAAGGSPHALPQGPDCSPATLPESVRARCRDFVHSYGLTFGVLDLLVTPSGEYVFLENNPVGQFLHIEERVPALGITDAVVDCLARNSGG